MADDSEAQENGRRDNDRIVQLLQALVKALELRQIEHERRYFDNRKSDAKLFRVWRNKNTIDLANLEARISNMGQTSEKGIEKILMYLRVARWGGYGLVIMLTGYITLFIDRFKTLFVIGSD
ncbi:MAG: hypothetical protein GY774_04980 [Planctomycetes bacterium]|nr:hypothetical protein [Planctomycetota bacterium]